MRVLSIVRLELCAAVIAKRLALFVQQEIRFSVDKRYFLLDSQIVRSMIAKESYAFTTFVSVRLGEIHQSTNIDEWHWIDTTNNAADWITRGKASSEFNSNSVWQRGPDFLCKVEQNWPLKKNVIISKLPEENVPVTIANISVVKSIENLMNIDDYSKYLKLIHVTGRIISVFRKIHVPSFANIMKFPSGYIMEAEMLWVIEAQKLLKDRLARGEFKRLCSRIRDDGLSLVGGRMEDYFDDTYNSSGLILLPHTHRIAPTHTQNFVSICFFYPWNLPPWNSFNSL